nr:unnamed protein product [Callosobruchus chinensis]
MLIFLPLPFIGSITRFTTSGTLLLTRKGPIGCSPKYTSRFTV